MRRPKYQKQSTHNSLSVSMLPRNIEKIHHLKFLLEYMDTHRKKNQIKM